MTHKDIYKKFMIEYDKANITSSYPSLTKYEIATILDKAYLALIARKFTGNNTRNAGFESDLKAIEDLRPLIVTKRRQLNDRILPQAKNDRRYSLPEDLLYYVKSDIATKDNTRIPTLIVTHNMIDSFKETLTNYPWIDTPVAFILSSDIHVLIDPESDNSVRNGELDVTYIKKPAGFVNSMVNGDEPDEPITPDEPIETTSFEITSENPYVITVPADSNGLRIQFHGVLTTYRDGVEVSTEHRDTFEEVALTPNTDVNSYITRGEKFWNGQVCKWEITQLGAEKQQSSTTYYSVKVVQSFENCSITGIGNYAEGLNVAVTISANSGYMVKKVAYQIGNTEYVYPTDESTRPTQSVPLTFTLTGNALITDIELALISNNNPVPTPPPVVEPEDTYTECTVTIRSADVYTGSISYGGRTYKVGDTIEVKAKPNSTYMFDRWESDIEGIPTNQNPLSFTLTKITSPTYTITAYFKIDRTPEYTDYYLEGINYRYKDIQVKLGTPNKNVDVYGDYRKVYVGAYQGVVNEDVEAIFDDPTVAVWFNGTMTALKAGTTYVQFKHKRLGYTTNRILVTAYEDITNADPNQLFIIPSEIHAKVGDNIVWRSYKCREYGGLYSIQASVVTNMVVTNEELLDDMTESGTTYPWSCVAAQPGVVTVTITPKTGDNPEQYSATATIYITED